MGIRLIGKLEEIRNYWSMRAEGYSESIIDEFETNKAEHWKDVILNHVDTDRPLKILDVGTGPGFFPILLGREGHKVTAVDYTEAMLEEAEKNCRRYNVCADLSKMDAHSLEFDDDSFDLILSRNLIWDLENPKKAYAEWLRVLKPEGKMMVFDGNHYLHLYDNDYADAHKIGSGEVEHRYIKNVDSNIIKDIAKELPLSKERRPQWDVNTLIEMGVRSVKVDTDGKDSYCVQCNGEDVYLPFSFMICVTK